MAELTLKQQEQLDAGSFVNETLYNGYIAQFAGRFNPSKSEHIDFQHYDAWCEFLDSIARLLRSGPQVYVYKDSADTALQYSVKAFSLVIGGVIGTYAGQVARGPLTAATLNYIFADLAAFPTIAVGSNTTGFLATHLQLAEITPPASGHWKEQHFTSRVNRHALAVDGVGASSGRIIKEFAYNSSSPLPIGTIGAGKRVVSVRTHVETALNGTTPLLTVGDAGDADRLMTAAQNDPKTIGAYDTDPGYKYAAETAVNLTITPDASSAGAGFVVLEVA